MASAIVFLCGVSVLLPPSVTCQFGVNASAAQQHPSADRNSIRGPTTPSSNIRLTGVSEHVVAMVGHSTATYVEYNDTTALDEYVTSAAAGGGNYSERLPSCVVLTSSDESVFQVALPVEPVCESSTSRLEKTNPKKLRF